jgi:hypothetical protein
VALGRLFPRPCNVGESTGPLCAEYHHKHIYTSWLHLHDSPATCAGVWHLVQFTMYVTMSVQQFVLALHDR